MGMIIRTLGIGATLTLVACTTQAPSDSPRPTPTTARATTTTPATPATTISTSTPSGRPTQVGSGLPPSGTWQVDLTATDLTEAGWSADVTPPGTYTWIFEGNRATLELDPEGGKDVSCEADMESAGESFRLTYDDGACGGEVDQIRWELNGEELHLTLISTNAPLDQQRAYLETEPWLPVGSD
jgi:hypothetical protein